MLLLLWLLAVVLVIGGIVALARGFVLYGLVLIIVGFLVGPGGVSVFTVRENHVDGPRGESVGGPGALVAVTSEFPVGPEPVEKGERRHGEIIVVDWASHKTLR
jgi:hypothetical protein